MSEQGSGSFLGGMFSKKKPAPEASTDDRNSYEVESLAMILEQLVRTHVGRSVQLADRASTRGLVLMAGGLPLADAGGDGSNSTNVGGTTENSLHGPPQNRGHAA
eukprot:COSAG01_NODE_10768_length_2081_cov_1.177330_2_plen_105_part_00